MIMKKLFGFAAIILAFAACNKIEPIETPEQSNLQAGIPFTATVIKPASKALSDAGSTVTASWAENEKVALIYTVSETKYLDVANIDSVDGSGNATISAKLSATPADNTLVTVIYPASAVDASSKELKADLLTAQKGNLIGSDSISEKYDVRIGSGNFSVAGSAASFKANVSLVNQFVIWKLTLNAVATELRVTIDGVDYVVTPWSATNPIYVALPAISGKAISFKATEGGVGYYFSVPSLTLAAGTYYQTNLSSVLKTNPGRLGGQFSVSSTKKVYFSKGNLQWFYGGNIHKTKSATAVNTPIAEKDYNGGVFTFADNQWDISGATGNNSTVRRAGLIGSYINDFTSAQRIDLFMYASSGYRYSNGDYHFKPFAICNSSYWGGSYAYGPASSGIDGTNNDWGVFNAILNGGDETDQWRTLTQSEWAYLANERANAVNRRGVGTVNGIRGVILLPDDWAGSAITALTNTITIGNSDKPASINWTDNVYSDTEWAVMEANGAVFLPAAGTLDPGNNAVGYYNVSDTNAGSSYWTSSYCTNREYAYALDLGTGGGSYINWRFDQSSRPFGRAVRLVKDVE